MPRGFFWKGPRLLRDFETCFRSNGKIILIIIFFKFLLKSFSSASVFRISLKTAFRIAKSGARVDGAAPFDLRAKCLHDSCAAIWISVQEQPSSSADQGWRVFKLNIGVGFFCKGPNLLSGSFSLTSNSECICTAHVSWLGSGLTVTLNWNVHKKALRQVLSVVVGRLCDVISSHFPCKQS